MLQDLFEAAAEDIATGIDELVPSTPPSTPYSGDVVQSLVRRGLVQASACLLGPQRYQQPKFALVDLTNALSACVR